MYLIFFFSPDTVADEFSALEEIPDDEAISISVPPAIPPASTSLRDYVDQSEILSKLVQLGNKTKSKNNFKNYCVFEFWSIHTFATASGLKMSPYLHLLFPNCIIAGVNLWKLEQRSNVGSMLLKLDFNEDVAPRLLFLKEIGVDEAHFGNIITHNPFILTESVENLKARWQEYV